MSETQPIQTHKSDGSAGQPAVPVPVPHGNTPGARNSALKETPHDSEHYREDHPAAAHVLVVDADKGVVAASGRKNIAICGFASSSRALVPVDDPTWEVWGLNQLYRHLPRADRWFDIHMNWNEEVVPGTDYVGWIRGCGIPFYMAERQPNLPTSVRYPIERLVAKFGDYFTSTIAFMLALAIEEIDGAVDSRIAFGDLVGRDANPRAAIASMYSEYTIGIFGVDLVVGEEYFWQKACAEYWIGVACSRGINVMLPKQTALCKQLYRYGYEKEPDSLIKVSEIAGFETKMAREKDELMRQLYMRDGAIQAAAQMRELLELRLRGADVQPKFV